MKIVRRYIFGIVLFISTVTLFSCNLEDFNLKKLADPTDITPDVFAPFAYGTFSVKDFAVPPPAINFIIPAWGVTLNPVIIDKTGTSFQTSAIDTLYLLTHFTNTTPAEMVFDLRFIDKTTGAILAGPFGSGAVKIPAGAKDFFCQPIALSPADQNALQNSTGLKLNFTLFPPASGAPVLYNDVSDKSFTIKIAFHAKVQVWKL